MRRLPHPLAVAAALVLALAPSALAANADFGDAPDGAPAYVERDPFTGAVTSAIGGRFPSTLSSGGPRHTEAGPVKLGRQVDRERDSKQVDVDPHDDGFSVQLEPCRQSTYTFVVNLEDLPRRFFEERHRVFLNAWLDWNRDGDWEDVDTRCGTSRRDRVPERRVRNRRVPLSAFEDERRLAIVVRRRAGGTAIADDPFSSGVPIWIRATLTLDERVPRGGGGQFEHGETEDHGPGNRVEPEEFADADFGDAPDGAPAYFDLPAPGNFPSLYDSGGSLHEQAGPGRLSLGPDATVELNSRQVDADTADDGFEYRIRRCRRSTYTFRIDARNLPPGTLNSNGSVYLNAWFDWNRDGDWRDLTGCTDDDGATTERLPDLGDFAEFFELFGGTVVPEWAVVNREVPRARLRQNPVRTIEVRRLAGNFDREDICLRASVTLRPYKEFIAGFINDGLGDFVYGESEDYCPEPGLPPTPAPGGGGIPPGPQDDPPPGPGTPPPPPPGGTQPPLGPCTGTGGAATVNGSPRFRIRGMCSGGFDRIDYTPLDGVTFSGPFDVIKVSGCDVVQPDKVSCFRDATKRDDPEFGGDFTINPGPASGRRIGVTFTRLDAQGQPVDGFSIIVEIP